MSLEPLEQRIYNYLRAVWKKDQQAWVSESVITFVAQSAGYKQVYIAIRNIMGDKRIKHRINGFEVEFKYLPDIDDILDHISDL